MNKRYFILILTLFLGIKNLSGQSETVGKIIYHLQGTSNAQSTITLLFTKSDYIYFFGAENIGNLISPQKKTYENLRDSIDEIEHIKRIRESIEKAPPQTWYGELGSKKIISTWFNLYDDKTYCIQDSTSFMEWDLLSDTATIGGILCQKASGKYNGMNYSAWFAPSIPVSVGHLQYRGLPGLLIKCTNLTRNTTFEMLEMEWPAKNPVSFKPCNGSIYITQAQMAEMINKQNAKAMKILEAYQKAQKEGKKVNVSDLIKN
jgi:GLPGLI family protein